METVGWEEHKQGSGRKQTHSVISVTVWRWLGIKSQVTLTITQGPALLPRVHSWEACLLRIKGQPLCSVCVHAPPHAGDLTAAGDWLYGSWRPACNFHTQRPRPLLISGRFSLQTDETRWGDFLWRVELSASKATAFPAPPMACGGSRADLVHRHFLSVTVPFCCRTGLTALNISSFWDT